GFGRGDTGALDEDRGRVRGGAGPLVGVDLDADQLDLVGDRLGLLLARDLIGERQGVAGVRNRDGLSQCFVIAEELGHGALGIVELRAGEVRGEVDVLHCPRGSRVARLRSCIRSVAPRSPWSVTTYILPPWVVCRVPGGLRWRGVSAADLSIAHFLASL